jgi:hypothetical protein
LEKSDPLLSKLASRREELNWLYGRLDETDAIDPKGIANQIRKLEKDISVLQRRVAGSSDLSGLAQNAQRELDIAQLQGQLGKDRALIEFVEFDGHFSAFVITDSGISFVDGLAARSEIDRDIEGLRFQLSSFKYGAKVAAMESILARRTDAYLERLFDKLLARPIEQAGGRGLVIVPAGPLNYVPFHALREPGGYLIESRDVVVAPGAHVWLSLSKRRRRTRGGTLLMGFADESIPLVNAEIDALAGLMPEAKRFTDAGCTFAEYLRQAPGAAVIHLACHGDFRAEDPNYSSLHLAEGWVTAGDVARQKLNAELVTLSACDTGVNKVAAGEEVLGMARGFLSAGVRNVILSHWAVNDTEAPRLMQDLYTEIQLGTDVAASLRKAQINAIRRGANPYIWAPYFLIGAG